MPGKRIEILPHLSSVLRAIYGDAAALGEKTEARVLLSSDVGRSRPLVKDRGVHPRRRLREGPCAPAKAESHRARRTARPTGCHIGIIHPTSGEVSRWQTRRVTSDPDAASGATACAASLSAGAAMRLQGASLPATLPQLNAIARSSHSCAELREGKRSGLWVETAEPGILSGRF